MNLSVAPLVPLSARVNGYLMCKRYLSPPVKWNRYHPAPGASALALSDDGPLLAVAAAVVRNYPVTRWGQTQYVGGRQYLVDLACPDASFRSRTVHAPGRASRVPERATLRYRAAELFGILDALYALSVEVISTTYEGRGFFIAIETREISKPSRVNLGNRAIA